MTDGTPDHWDPKPDERVWYRSQQTGDRAYFVRRDGRDCVRLDRPGEEIIRKLNEAEWMRDDDYRPYTRHQVAMLLWTLDRGLLRMMGRQNEGKAEWATLPEEKRIQFMKDGPADASLRSELWSACMGVLEKHSR